MMHKIALICIPVIGWFASSCNNDRKDSQARTGQVPVVSVLETDISLDKIHVADIQAAQNIEIRSRVPGFLERIFVDEGQFVKKGQLLFTISDQEYKAEVARAKAGLNSALAEALTAELEVEKVQQLVDKKIVSKTELAVARAKHQAMKAKAEEAQAALNHAGARLSYTVIKAPYDGVIDRIPLKPGSLLEEGTLITTVSDISSVFAYFNISENEYLDYLRSRAEEAEESMASVKLILSDGVEYEHGGKVETVVSEFQETTGSIAFRARFPNPDHLLKHGATGKIKLTRELEEALMLPQKAVFEIQDKNYVFVLDSANKVNMRSFNPKARVGDFYVVASGLRKGEKIVYEGIQNIKDGMKVEPMTVQLDSIKQSKIL